MLHKTDAICLRLHPYSKTSEVITWLSPRYGRFATLAKGAHRARSAFLGQADLAGSAEVVFHARPGQSLAVLRECAVLAPRPGLRADWRAAVCALYVCALVERVGTAEPHAALYALTAAALDTLEREVSWPLVLYFETRLLSALGFAPRLSHCVSCGARAGHDGAWRFVPRQGGVLCPGCLAARNQAGPDLAPEALAVLRRWQQGPKPGKPAPHSSSGFQPAPSGAARMAALPMRSCLELSAVLGVCLQEYLDALPPGRRIALELTARQP
jgi:DNA repair protein RecO (recombination protein O)